MNSRMPLRIAGILSLAILLSLGTAVFAFSGPPSAPGTGGGAVRYNSVSGSVGIGTLPLDGSQSSLMVAATSTRIYGLEVLRLSGERILLTGENAVTIATPSAKATTTINGDLIVTGTITGLLGSVTLPAENVVSGVFGLNTGGGATPPYAFPGNLGVGTSTQTSLPQTLSVYGNELLTGTLQAGTSTFLGQILANKGTNLAPGIANRNYPDTGIQFGIVSTYDISLITNQSEMLRVQGSGAVTLPHSASRLEIRGFGSESAPAIQIGLSSVGGGIYAPSSGGLVFTTEAADTSVEQMRIATTTGNVGIGTKNPSQKLDVNGALRLMPTSTVPTASDGVSYFNASAGKFKCYEGGWWNCVGMGGTSAGVPSVTDCDTDLERGRTIIDTSNNRFYICNGQARGWDYILLID